MTIRKTRHTSGIELEPSDTTTDTLNREGQIAVDSTDKEVKVYLDSAQRTVVTEDQVQVLTNKTIDADDNTISDLEVDNLKTGVLNTSTTLSGATDSQVPSALAVKTYIESSSGSVQSDVDDLVSLSGVAANSTDLGTFTGSVIPDSSDVKEALQALETSVETKGDVYGPATSTDNALARFDLATGKLLQNSVVTVSDTGVVAGSSIDADTNTITNIENADIKAAAAIDRSKLASGTNNAVVHNDGSGVMINSSDLLVATNALTLANTKHLEIQASTDATTTGANATLSAFTSGAVRLTNGSLTSVETIPAGSNGQELTLFNRTGVDFTIPTSGNILSGTNAQITVKNNSALQLSYDSTSTKWQIIGGTGSGEGSSGIINYITDPSCELAVTSWSTYADAAGTSPVDGTGGSPSVTVSNSITSPLRGLRSLVMVKDAANRQGNGISIPFTIDVADKSKVLQISFDYKVFSGTYADNDVSFWVYDVTNAVMIQPAPYLLKNAIGAERMGMEFQASTSTSYRLIAHVASTSALAYSLQFDNFFLGVSAKLYGSPITDAISITPTGTFTNSTYTGKVSRLGGSASFDFKVTLTGTPAAATFDLTLPTGYSMDTARMVDGSNVNFNLGIAKIRDDSSGISYEAAVRYINPTTVRLYPLGSASTFADLNSAVNASTPIVFAVNDSIHIQFTIPILGWSSSTIMSSDASTRVIAAYATGTPASVTSGNPIIYPTVTKDSHGAYNASTGRYTAPTEGFYQVSAAGATVTGVPARLNLFVNASLVQIIGMVNGADGFYTSSGIVYVKAGDLIDVRPNGNLSSFTSTGSISFNRLSGPAQIAASSIVSFSANTSTTAATSSNPFIYTVKDHDTHSAYSTITGKFTAPMSGNYFFTSTNYAGVTVFTPILYKGAASKLQGSSTIASTSTGVVSHTIFLLEGETVEIRPSVSATSSGNSAQNTFSGFRIGGVV